MTTPGSRVSLTCTDSSHGDQPENLGHFTPQDWDGTAAWDFHPAACVFERVPLHNDHPQHFFDPDFHDDPDNVRWRIRIECVRCGTTLTYRVGDPESKVEQVLTTCATNGVKGIALRSLIRLAS